MTIPLISVGMATFDDYHGVYFSIQDIRLNHPELMSRVEFIVIDNAPHLVPVADAIKNLFGNMGADGSSGKYIPMAAPVGTSPSRNAIFTHATGKYVLAMDCHVLLAPGALQALIDYYTADPECNDIISGPMVYDNMVNTTTHFNPIWRAEMYGTWASAWECSCSKYVFTMAERDDLAIPSTLDMRCEQIHNCPVCNKTIEIEAWGGHEAKYLNQGFRRPGMEGSNEPFEIPGQGLGLFSCRREAWLGFHPAARGFGGEELYIHEKYRQAGHRAMCLPDLKWLHRFGRPEGPKYPLTRWFKIRNYVLFYQELGWDLKPVYDHFVPTGLMGEAGWNKLIGNAVENELEVAVGGCNTCGGSNVSEAQQYTDVETLFAVVKRRPRDLDEHMDTLRTYAGKCERVTEFTARKESTIAFLAGLPKTVTSYSTEVEAFTNQAAALVKDQTAFIPKPFAIGQILPTIDDTDLCFIDTRHNYATLSTELAIYGAKTTRFIIMHDTVLYGQNGDDGLQGLMLAIYEFIQKNSQWDVADQYDHQYGLTILACREEDFPQGPGRELKLILKHLGIRPTPHCSCNTHVKTMNAWGVEMCKENREQIITWLNEGKGNWGWGSIFDMFKLAGKVAASALTFGSVVWKLNPFDPIPGLVDEAIRRAEVKENGSQLYVDNTAPDSIVDAPKGGGGDNA
jgi:hypothetical protein